MNIITKSLMRDFITKNELISQGDTKDFEKFSAYAAVRKLYGKEFDLDSVVVGDGCDTGIDGIAIIVNGALVNSKEEIEDLKQKNNYLDVTYILIQAKISEKFDASEIGTFCRGIQDFFLSNIGLKRNDDITNKVSLFQYLTDNAILFRENPKCFLYFICNGVWSDSLTDHKAIISETIKKLEDASLFSRVLFKPNGANEVNVLYKESRNQLMGQIYFTSKATFPQIPKITSAYTGVLPLSEFKKLIVDDDGCIKNVFEDNIRDFQELSNSVNGKIDETLKSDHYKWFPLLNNGITIVADRISQTGDSLILYDYQIVNGCQTTNVLFKNVDDPKLQDLSIPIKIIETNDEEAKNNITLATNNQTPVKREQLAALSEFQRNLEDYYNANITEAQLVYERRLNQYASNDSIYKSKIISVQNQIKSFAAMFLRRPHVVTSYFGELTKNLATSESEIFNPSHLPKTYYLAGLSLHRLETLFRNGTISSEYKKMRFFLLLGFCIYVEKDIFTYNDLSIEKTNSRKLQSIGNVLSDADETNKMFELVLDKLIKSGIPFNKETLKQGNTTESVIRVCSH